MSAEQRNNNIEVLNAVPIDARKQVNSLADIANAANYFVGFRGIEVLDDLYQDGKPRKYDIIGGNKINGWIFQEANKDIIDASKKYTNAILSGEPSEDFMLETDFATVQPDGYSDSGVWRDAYRDYNDNGINVWSVSNEELTLSQLINDDANMTQRWYPKSQGGSFDETKTYKLSLEIYCAEEGGPNQSVQFLGFIEGGGYVYAITTDTEVPNTIGWHRFECILDLPKLIPEGTILTRWDIQIRLKHSGAKLRNPSLTEGVVVNMPNLYADLKKSEAVAESNQFTLEKLEGEGVDFIVDKEFLTVPSDGNNTNANVGWDDAYYLYAGGGANTLNVTAGVVTLVALGNDDCNLTQRWYPDVLDFDEKYKFSVEMYIPEGVVTSQKPYLNFVLHTDLGYGFPTGGIYADTSIVGWQVVEVSFFPKTGMPVGAVPSRLDVQMRFKQIGIKMRNPKMVASFKANVANEYADNAAKIAEENSKEYANSLFTGGNSVVYGEKLVTIGDSITEGAKWQPTVVGVTGLVWSYDETKYGLDGHAKMGQGGSKVVPKTAFWDADHPTYGDPSYQNGLAFDHNGDPIYEEDGITQRYWFYGSGPNDSLFMRSKDAHFYNPEHIIIMGGQNDGIIHTYDINDAPYTGTWVNTDVLGETAPSYVSVYKAMLEQLITDNPLAKIYITCRMYNGQVPITDSVKAQYIANRNLHKELADRYSCEFIDTLIGSGITPENSANFYSDTVHPNNAGGIRIGRFIGKNIR